MSFLLEVVGLRTPPVVLTLPWLLWFCQACRVLADVCIILGFVPVCATLVRAYFEAGAPQEQRRQRPTGQIAALFRAKGTTIEQFNRLNTAIGWLPPPSSGLEQRMVARGATPLGSISVVQLAPWTAVLFEAGLAPEIAMCLAQPDCPPPVALLWLPTHDRLGLGFLTPPTTGLLAELAHTTFAGQRWAQVHTHASLFDENTHDLLPLVAKDLSGWLRAADLGGVTCTSRVMVAARFGDGHTSCLHPLGVPDQ